MNEHNTGKITPKETRVKINFSNNIKDYLKVCAKIRDLEDKIFKQNLNQFADDMEKQIRTGPTTKP